MNFIRRAKEKDIPKVLDLLVQVCMVHHNGRPDLFKGPATKYTEEELKWIFADEKTPAFVCVGENDIVKGYAFCVIQEDKNSNILTDIRTLYIDDICVDEKCRRQHVGQAIYEYVIDYAKEIDCYNVTLNVWECNPGAKKFYEKCGMKPQKIGMEKIL